MFIIHLLIRNIQHLFKTVHSLSRQRFGAIAEKSSNNAKLLSFMDAGDCGEWVGAPNNLISALPSVGKEGFDKEWEPEIASIYYGKYVYYMKHIFM